MGIPLIARRLLRGIRKLSSPYLLVEVLLKKNLALLAPRLRGRVADFGCGDFRLSRSFLGQVDKLIGIDNWLAAEYHRTVPEGASFYYGSIEQTPFAASSLDGVICTEVIEHAGNPEAVVEECRRVLRGGGCLLLSVPFNFFVHGAPNDFRRYTIFGLDQLLRRHGFELVEHVVIGNTLFTLLNIAVTWLGYRWDGPFGSLLRFPLVAALNLIGLLLTWPHRPRLLAAVSAADHDRTSPLGYALLAQQTAPPPEALTTHPDPVVCPGCYSPLDYRTGAIRCTSCSRTFGYYGGVPVLAGPELLHLEHEGSGMKVTL